MAGEYWKEWEWKFEMKTASLKLSGRETYFLQKVRKKELPYVWYVVKRYMKINIIIWTDTTLQFIRSLKKKSKIREGKLQSLKKSFACERSTLFNAMNKNELTTKTSN